jgi:hypothetical protein
MDEHDCALLLAAIDEWVQEHHQVSGFLSWHDDPSAAGLEPEMVFPHAGYDAEEFCLSEVGQRVLRRIFGRPQSSEAAAASGNTASAASARDIAGEFKQWARDYIQAPDYGTGGRASWVLNRLVAILVEQGEAGQVLTSMLEDPEPSVRLAAAASLVGLADPPQAAIRVLRSLLPPYEPAAISGTAMMVLTSHASGYFLTHEADGTPAPRRRRRA